MGQSPNPDVAVNKDSVDYEEQITKMAMEALQMPKKRVPGRENIMAGTFLRREGPGKSSTDTRDSTLCFLEVTDGIYYIQVLPFVVH